MPSQPFNPNGQAVDQSVCTQQNQKRRQLYAIQWTPSGMNHTNPNKKTNYFILPYCNPIRDVI